MANRHLVAAFCVFVAGCDGDIAGAEPADTTTPVPLDAGGSEHDNATSYKGMPLALTDNGSPAVAAVDGVIGLICVGMSNGNQECSDFRERLDGEYASAVNPAVRVVNCAVGGHAIERWIDPVYDDALWRRCITQRLPQAGVRLDQVRVIWHKAANQFTTLPGGAAKPLYPEPASDYEAFLENSSFFARRVRDWFPNAQAVYTSSRSYGGFAGNPGRGEPLSYEEGHALNTWLAANRLVDGVWYGWAAYLWAPACTSGATNGSGVCYDRSDYVDDGVHPSPSGRAKVSAQLHARFLREAWYARQ
jgi:hypothetical protein